MQKINSCVVLSQAERYCRVEQDEIRFIGDRQTLSVVLGSCISTVFIGKNSGYYLAANHIVIAKPQNNDYYKKKSAEEHITEILRAYNDVYNINVNDIFCLHLIGAGSMIKNSIVHINTDNIAESRKVLTEKKLNILFNDTGSYCTAIFSLNTNFLSVFIEDKLKGSSVSYIIDLDTLFKQPVREFPYIPASALIARNKGFEYFVRDKIILSITGSVNR